jgi:hypothetical protein
MDKGYADIDVVFLPRQLPRDEAVTVIDAELAAIGQRVASLALRARRFRGADVGDRALFALSPDPSPR